MSILKRKPTKRDEMLCALLDCGPDDLKLIDRINYDPIDIVWTIERSGTAMSLNAILNYTFDRATKDLYDKVQAAWEKVLEERDDVDPDKERDWYEYLEDKSRQFAQLNPARDIEWQVNYGCTEIWFEKNEALYRKLLPDEIKEIEDLMGFDFEKNVDEFDM